MMAGLVKSSSRILPAELSDMIFRNLLVRNDKKSLSACSLVCSAWLPSCQANLYNSCVVKLNVGDAPEDKPVQDFSRFLEEFPHIGTFIRNLRVAKNIKHGPPKADTHILPILEKLSSLRKLVLDNLRLPPMPQVTDATRRFPTVRRLHLAFRLDKDNFLAFISMFPSLKELTARRMDSLDFPIPEADEYASLQPSSNIDDPTGLQLDSLTTKMNNMMFFVYITPFTRRLSSFQWYLSDRGRSWTHPLPWFSTIGQTLTQLTLNTVDLNLSRFLPNTFFNPKF